MIYLDANSTTFMPDLIIKAMVKWTNKGNPSSNYESAKECKKLMEVFKESVLNDNGFTNHTVIFTSGASESNAHILNSAAKSFINQTNYLPHIIISSIEHKSIIGCCEDLKEDGLCTYTKLNVRQYGDNFGTIDPEELENSIRPNTCLISIMNANNETGIINDIPALAAVAHRNKIPFHTDCTQTFGKMGVYNGVDACSLSFHKMYGPPGVGLLIIRNNFIQGYKLKSLISGTQNNDLRGGTENMPGIGASYAAYKYNGLRRLEKNEHVFNMREYLKTILSENIPCFYIDEFHNQKHTKNKIFWIANRNNNKMLVNTILLTVYKEHFCNVRVKEELEKNNVILSIGSACNTKSKKASNVINALNIPPELKSGVLRISLMDNITKEEITMFAKIFLDIVLQ